MKTQTITLFLSLFYLLSGLAYAQPVRRKINTSIKSVTVFTSAAQVNREGVSSLPTGKSELIFAGISPYIDKQSIQLKGEGAFTILSVIHQINYLNERQRRTEIENLRRQKEQINSQKRIEQRILRVYKSEEAMLAKNQSIGGSNNGVKTADLQEAVNFQRKRLREVLLKQLEIENKLRNLDSSNRKIDKQLKALNQNKDFATSEVLVTVSAKTPVNAKFKLSYLVAHAGWFPTYDLRVKDISSPLDIAFKANIFQNSGEDWKNVKLSVSNGNPVENGNAPTMQPWRLRFGYNNANPAAQRTNRPNNGTVRTTPGSSSIITGRVTDPATGEGLPGVSVFYKGTTIGTVTDIDGNYSLQRPSSEGQVLVFQGVGYITNEVTVGGMSSVDLALQEDTQSLNEVVVTGYSRRRGNLRLFKKKDRKEENKTIPIETSEYYQPTTVVFDIDVPYTILSDNKVYLAELKTEAVEVEYEYFAVPKIDEAAYLTAQLTDWQDLNLLDGEANIFFEGAFLGKSLLEVGTADDTLMLSLGKDKGITVKRKLLKDYSKRQFLSGFKKESRAYEITIRNNKREQINIVVQDQFPIPTDKRIEVSDQKYSKAELDEQTQILTWQYKLGAKKERKHELRYTVKYPRNQILILD